MERYQSSLFMVALGGFSRRYGQSLWIQAEHEARISSKLLKQKRKFAWKVLTFTAAVTRVTPNPHDRAVRLKKFFRDFTIAKGTLHVAHKKVPPQCPLCLPTVSNYLSRS
ncbi:hypothetical protein TNCV_4374541 [Trichonephila clavipes]|uniref:Uncharacterized protein n=1 Tax=Trichonephila clavipes TaxID=2585209 RepID=A0A8X6RCR7_TRICX|nr:hypothetical protein TNCV_4374541 [Trichonephila clavipes]